LLLCIEEIHNDTTFRMILTQRNVKSGHLLQRDPDIKTNFPIDRRSQYNFVLILIAGVYYFVMKGKYNDTTLRLVFVIM
jgi:hypothetical protein